jgi:hypothetical protein
MFTNNAPSYTPDTDVYQIPGINKQLSQNKILNFILLDFLVVKAYRIIIIYKNHIMWMKGILI